MGRQPILHLTPWVGAALCSTAAGERVREGVGEGEGVGVGEGEGVGVGFVLLLFAVEVGWASATSQW